MSDAHVILAGQSNALGFGNTGAAPYVPTARVQIWVGDAWHYMQPGVNTGTPENPTVWGPEVGLANAWLQAHPTGVLWIAKVAHGSTGLAADPAQLDWSPQSRGEMYDTASGAVHAAQANLAATPYAFAAWDVLDWMQGETDATDAAKAGAYGGNLADFVGHARADWDVGQVVAGRIGDGASMPYAAQVRLAEWSLDQADAQLASFKTIGFEMQADDLHYDAAGQLSLGHAFYAGWAL